MCTRKVYFGYRISEYPFKAKHAIVCLSMSVIQENIYIKLHFPLVSPTFHCKILFTINISTYENYCSSIPILNIHIVTQTAALV